MVITIFYLQPIFLKFQVYLNNFIKGLQKNYNLYSAEQQHWTNRNVFLTSLLSRVHKLLINKYE